MSRKEISEEKLAYNEKLNSYLDTYSKVIFCTVDNVRSQQLHNIRKALRGKAEVLMGKNTMQKKIITLRSERDEATANDAAMKATFVDEKVLSKNCGLIFTNEDLGYIKEVLLKYKIQAPARVGAIAPCDIIIPAGNTGLEPTQTAFFQVLNIATKISKGTVEIINDKVVLKQNEKVDSSIATLLAKLNITPFYYALEILSVWDRGVLFTADDLKTTDADIEAAIGAGIANVTALSLGAGIPTEASFPHLVLDAFKDLLAVSIATNYEFTEFNGVALRKAAKDGVMSAGPAAPAAPVTGGAKPAPPPKKAPEPEPEEEDDVGLGGLF